MAGKRIMGIKRGKKNLGGRPSEALLPLSHCHFYSSVQDIDIKHPPIKNGLKKCGHIEFFEWKRHKGSSMQIPLNPKRDLI